MPNTVNTQDLIRAFRSNPKGQSDAIPRLRALILSTKLHSYVRRKSDGFVTVLDVDTVDLSTSSLRRIVLYDDNPKYVYLFIGLPSILPSFESAKSLQPGQVVELTGFSESRSKLNLLRDGIIIPSADIKSDCVPTHSSLKLAESSFGLHMVESVTVESIRFDEKAEMQVVCNACDLVMRGDICDNKACGGTVLSLQLRGSIVITDNTSTRIRMPLPNRHLRTLLGLDESRFAELLTIKGYDIPVDVSALPNVRVRIFTDSFIPGKTFHSLAGLEIMQSKRRKQ